MAAKRRWGAAAAAGKKKRGKRELLPELPAALRDAALRGRAGAAWSRGEPLQHEAVAVEPAPFRHGVIPGFLASPGFAESLRDELLGLSFQGRRNDLLSLRQSQELAGRPEPHVAALRHVLCEEFRAWLSAVTQIELEPTIDISCAKYEYTDVLLCHDDELEGRRVAFILYLVPPWEKSDGGTLDLYSTDEHSQPQQIVKSLVPSWNTLVFFEVSPVSFHQVSEVLAEGKCRLSLSGWFHGPPTVRPTHQGDTALPCSPHIPHDHEILYEWINLVYLDMDSQAQIQEEFEERSEILLKNFLKKEKYQLLCEALESKDIEWSSRGPANKRLYEAAAEESLPELLKQFLQLLRSEALFLLLSNFTGLKLHFLAPSDEDEGAGEGRAADTAGQSSPKPEEETKQQAESSSHQPAHPDHIPAAQGSDTHNGPGTPLCAGELRRWAHGHYTLVHDTQATEFALDLLFFCGCEDWDPEYGGFTSYIAKGEDEELLTVNPEDNCLALVYRDKETLKFVKYINHRSSARLGKQPHRTGFWDFSFVYYE
ncbi:prolyl 3-hydroxylase OGFOD1 isoform X2 [Apus apus]|uniref:prolyl 3-hydroxylase OGFOD1 isoform X2 n=1 Tax=Apus apus TaxID=8895 RepID=UPI0021F8FF4E|nr:prolyl 3-hydroxylase OGFOD1 isoform X2 [Apus apus]